MSMSSNNTARMLSVVVDSDSIFVGSLAANYKLMATERLWIDKHIVATSQYLDLLKASPIIALPHYVIRICFKSDRIALVPKSQIDILNTSDLRVYSLIDQPFGSIWKVDPALLSALKQLFPKAHVHHISTVYSNYLYPGTSKICLANIQKDHSLYLSCMADGLMLMYNHYICSTAEDYLYYISHAYQSFGLDPAHDVLILSGEIESKSQIMGLLKKYFGKTRFDDNAMITLAADIQSNSKHYYFDLYANLVCG